MIVSTDKAKAAAATLGVALEGLTADAVQAAYRAAAKTCHPDYHSGMAEQWARVSWAKMALKHWLRHHTPVEQSAIEDAPCFRCAGTGRVAVAHKGFGRTLTMQCTGCGGLGVMIEREADSD